MLLESAAKMLNNMYLESRRREHLDLVIATWRYAVSSMPDGDTSQCQSLLVLGSLLRLRYESCGDMEDLEDAITAFGQLLEVLPEIDGINAAIFPIVGAALQVRFERLGNMEDLEQAVVMFTRAVDLTPDGHPDKPNRLSNLGNALHKRFERLGGMDDLGQAVVMNIRAVDLTPNGHPDKPSQLNNLGIVLQERFQQLGGMDDLEQAVVMFSRAVDLTPDGHSDKPNRLSNFGNILDERFRRLGGIDDLERAVVMKTCAVDLTPDGRPHKPSQLNNLGNVLRDRFQRLSDIDDLEQSVVMNTRAVDLTPDGHPDKPLYLNGLGIILQERFERLGGMDDLEQAIVMNTHAVDLTPDGHPNKPAYLGNLGSALQKRFQRLGGMDDLEQAVLMKTHAVDLIPDGHPGQPNQLNILGDVFRQRFQQLGDMDDLEKAVMLLTRAVDLIPNGHSRRTHYLHHLASVLYTRYQSSYKQPTDLTRAITLSTEAALDNSGNPMTRLDAAVLTTSLLLHDPTEHSLSALMQAHQHVLNLIPQVAWLGNNIRRRYEQLADLGTLANEAAAVAIAVGEYSRAVEWLESGRTIVWSQLLHLRTPLDKLRECDSKLASELEHVSRALEHASTSSDKMVNFAEVSMPLSRNNNNKHPEMSPALEAKSHHRYAIEYDRLIKQIRSLDGFENFLCPKPFSELVPACTSGPVVIINVHRSRCDALILLPPDEIAHVSLPQFSYDRATSLFRQLTQVLGQNNLLSRLRENTTDDPDRALKPPESTRSWREVLRNILADLWKLVVKPIVNKIIATVSILYYLLIPQSFYSMSRI
jgi:tetratricopeptide (TPR) repeat protein